MAPTSRLAVIAGGGTLPARVIAASLGSGRPAFVVAFEGITDPATVVDTEHAWVRLGSVAATFAALRRAAVTDVVLAGPVRRPSVASLGLDRRGLGILASLGTRALGDGAVLARIVAEFEAEGFRVLGVEQVLGDALAPEGPIGRLEPDAAARADIALGRRVARVIGDLDIGQAVVVQQGVVLGVEAAEGTDALLARCASLRREGPGGVLVKMAKPGQDRRVDLPAIGTRTVASARAAGLRGIAVSAAAALVLDRAGVARDADAGGLFVVGVTHDDP